MAEEGQRVRLLPLLQAGAAGLGLSLNEDEIASFDRYLREIQLWSQRINLSALREIDAIQVHHFLDSLTLVPLLDELFPRGGRLIDVGSGAGFPGLPLKIVRPAWSVTLVEATQKKASFLSHVVEMLALKDTHVLPQRAEALAHHPIHRETYDIVTARAVSPLATLLELTLPFLRLGGVALLPKSRRQSAEEVERSKTALTILGGGPHKIHPAGAEDWLREREIVVVEKQVPTPSIYPRHPGIPAKRPL
jgi:16S rRNA (guanine527-N7)-methyltransferase